MLSQWPMMLSLIISVASLEATETVRGSVQEIQVQQTQAQRSLTALVSLIPRLPARVRGCFERTRERIAERAEEGSRLYNVPVSLLLTIALLETHWGCDHGEGGNWGAPISRTRRHTAGTPNHAASALATSYRVCGTWLGATRRFRYGLCFHRRTRGYSPEFAMHLSERVDKRVLLTEQEQEEQTEQNEAQSEGGIEAPVDP